MSSAITPGTKLGPYEVDVRIGAGGMGEVWKGKDTRLDRSVAIKVLPAELAADAQFRIRFEREAKTISQLSHPHICVLHDVGRQSVPGAEVDYLVMELLEGETLADRLTRGPMPIGDVLRIGAQIAEALDAAHRNGVVHRDLKPGNIMLTRSGAKLLDFGLARPSEIVSWSVGADEATRARPLTAEGTIVGTFYYMAPEQLEGAQVDPRTDIFALGVVLYEMATGRRPFDGATKMSLIAAIVDRDPPPMQQFQPLTPPLFEHVVSRCLAKDSAERWQSAHDVARELTWIREAGSQAGAAAAVTSRTRSRERTAWTIAAVALAAAIAGFIAWRSTGVKPPGRVMRFTIPSVTVSRLGGLYGLIAVSPDGGEIAYVATQRTTTKLFRRPVDRVEPIEIEGSEGAHEPFYSPDGRSLAFFARQKLMKVAVSGGDPIPIAHAAEPRGGVWGEDGSIYFCPFYYGEIQRVSAAGGEPAPVTKVDRAHGERSHRWPDLLPGGKVLIYTIGKGRSWDDATIVAQRLDSGERKVLIEGGCGARYLPTGHIVYVRGSSLYAVPFDVKSLAVTGQPAVVAEGVANSTSGMAEFSFTSDGMLVYYARGAGADEGGTLAIVNRRGESVPAMMPPFVLQTPRFSPDGTKTAGIRGSEVWTWDFVRGVATRITSGPRTLNPTWSPDGSRLYYSSERYGPWNVFWKSSDGGGDEHPVVRGDDAMHMKSVSPDDRDILVSTNRRDTGYDLDLVSTSDGRMRSWLRTDGREFGGVFSPDGRWIAYESDESGQPEIYVRSSSSSAGRLQISTGGGANLSWKSQDEIVYQAESRLMSVTVKTAPSLEVSKPQLLLDRAFADYDVARDGRILLVVPHATASGPGQINVVLNWFEDVRAKSGK